MSRKGDCWDNSVAESFFSTLKIERVFDTVYRTREEARGDIIDYIGMFYNGRRRRSSLGDLCPMDFEKYSILKKQLMEMFVFTGPHQEH